MKIEFLAINQNDTFTHTYFAVGPQFDAGKEVPPKLVDFWLTFEKFARSVGYLKGDQRLVIEQIPEVKEVINEVV